MAGSPFTMRPARLEDAEALAPRLRASDALEVSASYDDAALGLRNAIAGSTICDVGELGGVPVVIIGCAQGGEGVGIPWLLGTDELTRLPGALTKLARRYVRTFKERWPVLLNYVDARNTTSVRWLRRLGFIVREPIRFGKQGEKFHPFVMGS